MMIDSLCESLDRSVSGDAWHGPSLQTILSDLTAEEASARPLPGAHSILEIVLHTAAWIQEIDARIQGRAPALPEPGDWPAEAGWPEARARLEGAYRSLREHLAAFPEAKLAGMVGPARDAPLGSGVTFAVMLTGLVEHNAYHGGQISLLKRALREVA
jgi:uncharacterized damage-inducible protein DinB